MAPHSCKLKVVHHIVGCVINNAVQSSKMTIAQMDTIADDLWLRQIETIGLELSEVVQKTRSVDGFYSIQVLEEAARC